jgi:ABC-type polysaccharide/polyol phosphate transport system ATPase subunit
MSDTTAIEFVDVTKTFSRHSGSMLLRSHVKRWFTPPQPKELLYALRGVSFRMNRGESLAVVGTNGAGKSTLLNLVAGIAQPTGGQVIVNGRIAALLELGSGFHPDLSGLENLRLNASLLGLSRKRTAELTDEIIEFSGIRDFIEEPLRTYSSGMVVRLAFSVAIHMDPDILLVDEVLGVGDQGFQHKCLEKIIALKKNGITLLCVSHATGMVREFCERAIWIDHGQLIMDGNVEEVTDAYAGHRFPVHVRVDA